VALPGADLHLGCIVEQRFGFKCRNFGVVNKEQDVKMQTLLFQVINEPGFLFLSPFLQSSTNLLVK